ncbi:MAG: PDZ domain-containing protein, partial [Pirellulaceae bacterium]|nr:PDZ domain-containing protein [Pirellulaceae bacterium]
MIRSCCRLLLVAFLFWSSSAFAHQPETLEKSKKSDYELYKMLIDALDQIERNYITEVDRRRLIESAIRGVLGELDPHSSYVADDELRDLREGISSEFGGIGVRLDADADGLKILSPIHGTPAYRAGLAAGDSILEIDGRSTEGLGVDEAAKQLKGSEGSKVALTVFHPGDGAAKIIVLIRENIRVKTVLGDSRKPDGTWNFMLDSKRKIGYVRLTAFSRDTAAELRQTLAEMKSEGMRALILDLRFNPGGLLAAAIETADLFVAEGRIVSAKGR